MTAISRSETLLSINNVTHKFGDKEVLSNVNARVDNLTRSSGDTTGQVVAFLGPSGCGKTTLLRILAGLEKATSGTVWIGEKQIPTRPGLVGLVDQKSTLYRNRTVFGNLKIAAKQTIKDNPYGYAWKMLCEMGLGALKDSYPSQLSGGQKQRAAIAQQLLCSEHFLLMDEPTAGLDPNSKKIVIELVTKVANAHDLNTIIIVTHDIRSAISMADTIWLMGRDGKTPGSRILEEYDLISMGLTWQPDIQDLPQFSRLERDIIKRFESI